MRRVYSFPHVIERDIKYDCNVTELTVFKIRRHKCNKKTVINLDLTRLLAVFNSSFYFIGLYVSSFINSYVSLRTAFRKYR